MVTKSKKKVTKDSPGKRSDTVVRVSRWLDDAVEDFLKSNKAVSLEYPSKRNFVDNAILLLLKKNNVRVRL